MKRYNPKELEPKWQQVWANSDIYTAEDNSKKPKYYALSFFPYPSGIGLHIGHSRNFTITDVAARIKRQQGYNVLHPMGWDSFGLPGENYAIKTGVTPQITTKQNTDNFRSQCKKLGLSIDWSREFGSTDPDYYKWTQWFFLLLLERGLAYEKESPQWWCDTDKTVLANEQVEAGRCWRCGNLVVKKNLKQWFFKITDYADRLVEDLEDLDWPEGIKTMQRNWIGKSKGAEVEFRIANSEFRSFIMGQKDISADDINAIGGRVEKTTKEGYLCVVFPTNKAKDFEELIVSKMQPGFWNEYIGNETVFIFKFEDGTIKRFVLGEDNEEEIGKLGADFNHHEYKGENPSDWLPKNEWYAPLFPNSKFQIPNSIKVFTTRPDTLFGATFMVLAPEHPLVAKITTPKQQKAVEQYVAQVSRKNEIERQEDAAKDKTGVFTGAYAINPVNNEQIPIWIADFVLAGYGTGAVFADACDERDFDFAKKYDIPLKPTVIPENDETEAKKVMNLEYSYTKEGILVNSGKYDGMKTSEARDKIVAELVEQGKAKEQVNYKIRDWLISRQRYWGAPIPVVHCPVDGTVAVPKDQLPLELPILEKFQPSGDGQSPLALATDWVNTTCPKCGGPAKRETDTMDGFACSSWYFLRFTDPHNNKEPFAQDKAKYWMPVDMYVGGAEHAVMHLLYARMWTKVMQDAGLIEFGEPFKALRNQGMLLAADGQKISKSKGNGISPEDIIEQGYGADALRMIVLFLAPFDMSTPWSNEGLAGVFRFLQRVWTISQKFIESDVNKPNTEAEGELYKAAHTAIKKVSRDVELMGYNTAIAALMLYTNELYTIEKNYGFAARDAWQFALTTLTQLLAPFAPHITEELWADLGHEGSVHVAPWPVHDDAFLVEHVIKIAVQVNGKLRGEIEVPHDATKEVIEAEARAHENVASYITGDPKKVIYVPGKILNFVV